MKRNPLSPLIKKAFSCTLLLAALLFASCDYWGEDWYKNGESGTEVTASNAETDTSVTFMMGLDEGVPHGLACPGAILDPYPAHKVTLTRKFTMEDHEVTQREFKSIMGNFPQLEGYLTYGIGDNYPVCASWYQAIAYCNKRSLAEGLTPCYAVDGISDWASLPYGSIPTSSDSAWDNVTCNWDADGYRLPTEAEWEYAARAGDSTTDAVTWSGTTDRNSVEEYAWGEGQGGGQPGAAGGTHEVKQKKPNAFGLYDMSGNVWEMCWDKADWNRDWHGYSGEDETDPTGPATGDRRICRGGSFYFPATSCTVVERYAGGPSSPFVEVGFRVCRTVK